MDNIKFRGSVFSLKSDKEGELKVVLLVPLSDMPQAIKLLTKLEKPLLFTAEDAGFVAEILGDVKVGR